MDKPIQTPNPETEDDLATVISALEKFLELPPESRIQVLEKLRELTDE